METINNIKKKFSDFDFHKFIIFIVSKGSRVYRIIFIFLLLISLLSVLYYWYKFTADYQWTEERKQAYITSKKTKEEFSEDKFFQVIVESEKNKQVFTETFNSVRDIFKD